MSEELNEYEIYIGDDILNDYKIDSDMIDIVYDGKRETYHIRKDETNTQQITIPEESVDKFGLSTTVIPEESSTFDALDFQPASAETVSNLKILLIGDDDHNTEEFIETFREDIRGKPAFIGYRYDAGSIDFKIIDSNATRNRIQIGRDTNIDVVYKKDESDDKPWRNDENSTEYIESEADESHTEEEHSEEDDIEDDIEPDSEEPDIEDSNSSTNKEHTGEDEDEESNDFIFDSDENNQSEKEDRSEADTQQTSVEKQRNSTSTDLFDDIGGLDKEIKELANTIRTPIENPAEFERFNTDPSNGVLLYGPPGTGKTKLAESVAEQFDVDFIRVEPADIKEKYAGEAEQNIQDLFEAAEEREKDTIIYFDEFDSIAVDREDADKDWQRSTVTQLLSNMDATGATDGVYIIASTNKPDQIDAAIRRGGRLDTEIYIGAPDEQGRKEIFEIYLKDKPVANNVDIDELISVSQGFVGADIENAIQSAVSESISDNQDKLYHEYLLDAVKNQTPSAMREFDIEVPNVSWDDIGGLESTKRELQKNVEWTLDYSDIYDDMNIEKSEGILLYGPPGTGKTLLIKAAANESNANFISVDSGDLLSKYVGESEKEVKKVFEKARDNSPAIIFFDEIDAIAGERGTSLNDTTDRVVNQLLTELEGVEQKNENIIVAAATNKKDELDSAVVRSGRLSSKIHVGEPDETARKEIFKIYLNDKPTADNIDIDSLVEATDGFVGADIDQTVREAAMMAVEELIIEQQNTDSERSTTKDITQDHLEKAIESVSQSNE